MSNMPSTACMEAAAKTTENLAKINPILGATIGTAILLVAFGASGISKIIEKCIDANKDN